MERATPWSGYLTRPQNLPAGLHWHGFLWKGNGNLLYSYKNQAERTEKNRPEFMASSLPAEMVGENLLRPRTVVGTWTDSAEAAAWMRQQWDENTPTETHVDPDDRQDYAAVTLSHGEDDIWRWWMPKPPGPSMVNVMVVSCPHKHRPDIVCPVPPK